MLISSLITECRKVCFKGCFFLPHRLSLEHVTTFLTAIKPTYLIAVLVALLASLGDVEL